MPHCTFGADGVHRGSGDSGPCECWDGNGNRGGSTVDAQDRYVTGMGSDWTYDAVGHLKTRIDGRGAWTFTYDALWNLVKATGPQAISYVVDARGRRVGRKVGGVLKQGFLYGDQLEPVAELDGSNVVVSRFVYGSRPHVPDYMIKGTDRFRIISDHLGSVRLVINSVTGAIVSRIDYDVWGNITSSTNLAFQPFGFAGGLRDDATGLTLFGFRDYDPMVGRWVSRDPIGFVSGSVNLFAYAGGDPVNYRDPNGLIITVLGEKAFQDRISLMMMKIRGSNRGAEIINTLDACEKEYRILPAVGDAFARDGDVWIDPDFNPVISTANGPERIASEIVLAHELGHLLGARDDGERRMNNVLENENPVRKDLGYPARTSYVNWYMGYR